jgi:hypothetical protein
LTILRVSSYSKIMVDPRQIIDLEIMGYATVLKDTMLPSRVPPVFRVKSNPACILFPPFHFGDGCVWNSTEGNLEEVKRLLEREEITILQTSIPAKQDYELWVDLEMMPHYEPRFQVRKALAKIAQESIAAANKALVSRDFKEANRLAGIALSADDHLLEPLVVKSVICHQTGDNKGANVLRKIASRTLKTSSFDLLVRECIL